MSKKLKEKKNTLPANISFEDDADSGFENTDVESFAVPFLAILQKLSPQVDEDSASRIKGAKAGMLFNTVTEKFYQAKHEDENRVLVIPVAQKRQFVEWTPRDSGGGIAGVYTVAEGLDKIERETIKDEKGRSVTEAGNLIADTRVHYVLADLGDGNWIPMIMAMSSTQIKHSKKWMSIMDNLKFERGDGTKYTPAMYSHIYNVSTQQQENAQGTWRGWKITLATVIKDPKLYTDAKEFRNKVVANEIVEAPMPGSEEATTEV